MYFIINKNIAIFAALKTITNNIKKISEAKISIINFLNSTNSGLKSTKNILKFIVFIIKYLQITIKVIFFKLN